MVKIKIIHKGLILAGAPLLLGMVYVLYVFYVKADAGRLPGCASEMVVHQSLLLKDALMAVVASVIVSVLLSLFFCININNRLLLIFNNTKSLSEGAALRPPLKGDDEIAELDQFLYKAATEIRQLERFKKEMISVVSHELKSPLTSVKTFLSTLKEGVFGELDKKAQEKVERTHRSVVRLMALVKELLYLDRLEIEMFPAQIDVDEILNAAVEAVSDLTQQSGIQVEVKSTGNKVFADRHQLLQVIFNLLSNGMKFSPLASRVFIEAENKDGWFECRIIDQGPGIPEDLQNEIFEPFKQIVATESWTKKGTGLGLTVARSIVEQHFGEIGVNSVEGNGSTFWFRIPATETESQRLKILKAQQARTATNTALPARAPAKRRAKSVFAQSSFAIGVPLVFQLALISFVIANMFGVPDLARFDVPLKEDGPVYVERLHTISTAGFVLGIGFVVNSALSILMAMFFIRSLTTRLNHVTSNTALLAKRQPLDPPAEGTDEIALLDKILFETGKRLVELETFKRDLVIVVSHELKTPLVSISSSLDAFSKGTLGELSDKGYNRLKIAQEESNRLIRLINDLLDIEKMEAGRFVLEISEMDVAQLIDTAIAAISPLSEMKQLKLETTPSGAKIWADQDRLCQVLINLLSNAIKYSPEGGTIKIAIEINDGQIEISVIDQGRGIPENLRELIFDRWVQVESADASVRGGSGLGLAIAKAIVEQHDGTIGVRSDLGHGSTFWIRLPIEKTKCNPSI